MHVLMLCNYPITKSEIFGGTSAVAHNLVQALIKYTPIKITTLTFMKKLTRYEEVFDQKNRIRIIRVPRRWKYTILTGFLPEKVYLKKIIACCKPNIIHAQGTDVYASLTIMSGLPNVFTVHGIRLKEIVLQKKELGMMRCLAYERLILNNLKRAKNIVATNKYTIEQIKHLHNAKVWIIRNPIDEEYLDIYTKEEPEAGKILLVGGIRARKDVLTSLKIIVELLKLNVKACLNIVGPIEENYERVVRSFIQKQKLEDYITIHDLISDEKLKELYKTADIFLLTSLEETSPVSVVQAMASGKPIVSTDVGGISEIVKINHNAKLHKKKDFKSMSSSLKELISDREKRDAYSKAGHQIAKENWSPKAVAFATVDMYRDILKL